MSDPLVTFGTNQAQFQAAFREYLAQTSRDLPEAINRTAWDIVTRAAKETPKADRAKFERELGVASYRAQTYKRTNARTGAVAGAARRDKRGNVRFRRVMQSGATLASLIVNARLGRAGKPGLHGSEMKAAVGRMLGKRARSVGTVKSGWANILRIFARAVGLSAGSGAVRVKGAGTAKTAKPGFSPQAAFAYNVASFDAGHQQYIDKRTQAALQKAFDWVTADKLSWLARKMAKTAEAANRSTK